MTVNGVNVTGYYGFDQVSMLTGVSPDASLLSNFKFFLISEAKNLQAISGVIGLGPLMNSTLYSYTERQTNATALTNVLALKLGNHP